MRGESCWRDHYVEWCVGSTQEKEPSSVDCLTSTKLFSNASASEDGGAGRSTLHPWCCCRENPIWGLLSHHLGPQPWWRQWLTPEGGDSFNDFSYWSFTYNLACSWAVTRGDWKITALVVRAELGPKGWPPFSWDFNLLWNDWPFVTSHPLTIP